MSPQVVQGSNRETTNAGRPHLLELASCTHSLLAATESALFITDGIGSITRPGNSHIGDEEPKPPPSEASSRTVPNRSDSAGDEPGFGRTPPFRGPGHPRHVYDENQHDPTIRDSQSPHVDLTGSPAPVKGRTYPSSTLSDLPGGKPRFPRIMTNSPPEPIDSGNLDSGNSRTIPTTSGGVRDSFPSRDEGKDTRSDRVATFPRMGGKRVVPGWGASEGTDERKRKETGEERSEHLHPPVSTPPVSNEVKDPSWGLNSTPVSPTRPGTWYMAQDNILKVVQRLKPSTFIRRLLVKLGVRKYARLPRSSSPSAVSQAQGGANTSSLRSNLPGGEPQLPRITENPPFGSGISNSLLTGLSILGASGEVGDSRPSDSTVNTRVMYSGSGPQGVVGSARGVVDVHKTADEQMESFQTQPLEPHAAQPIKPSTEHDGKREQDVVRDETNPLSVPGK